MEVNGQHHSLVTFSNATGVGQDVMVDIKIPAPSENRASVVQPIASHFSD